VSVVRSGSAARKVTAAAVGPWPGILAEYLVASGSEIWFRGSADRVDRAGRALVMVDYKTGSSRPFK
jgi:ATP-dependent helicase/nuclease subunit B